MQQSSAAIELIDPLDEAPVVRRPTSLLAELGEQAGDIAIECSDTGGHLALLNRQIADEAGRLVELGEAMETLACSRRESALATDELIRTAEVAHDVLDRGNRVAVKSLTEVSELIKGVTGLDGELQSFLDRLGNAGGITRLITAIAEQTEMLSLNARIEAARGGESTKPFQVLAEEMRRLAVSAAEASAEVGRSIVEIERTPERLITGLSANIAIGRESTRHIDSLRGSLGEMAALVVQFQDRSQAIAGCNERIGQAVETLDEGLAEFREVASTSAERACAARDRLDRLETVANDMLNRVAHGGVETRNTGFIELARQGADEITVLIEQSLAMGDLDENELFDSDYRPRAGTDPVQYDNRFADFADRHLRPILDRQTNLHRPVVGCCLVDMNGYLPTHITERSQAPIPGQRLRNLEFSRNRQIFMDGQTRRALDGNDEFYLYAYRQDLGEGRYRALRSVFVPLYFAGRKWGLYEVGYLI
jgi:methyl-accepting chemotaxis protein